VGLGTGSWVGVTAGVEGVRVRVRIGVRVRVRVRVGVRVRVRVRVGVRLRVQVRVRVRVRAWVLHDYYYSSIP